MLIIQNKQIVFNNENNQVSMIQNSAHTYGEKCNSDLEMNITRTFINSTDDEDK